MITILNDPFNVLFKAIETLYPNIKCDIQYSHELRTDDQEYGVTIFPDDKGTPLIEINPSLSIENAIEVIAHEIAHVVAGKEAEHSRKWEKEFDNINKQFYMELEKQYSKFIGDKL